MDNYKYLKELLWFHFVRLYNTAWSWLGLPLHTGDRYNYLDNSEAIKVIGWKPREWGYVDGVWKEIL